MNKILRFAAILAVSFTVIHFVASCADTGPSHGNPVAQVAHDALAHVPAVLESVTPYVPPPYSIFIHLAAVATNVLLGAWNNHHSKRINALEETVKTARARPPSRVQSSLP